MGALPPMGALAGTAVPVRCHATLVAGVVAITHVGHTRQACSGAGCWLIGPADGLVVSFGPAAARVAERVSSSRPSSAGGHVDNHSPRQGALWCGLKWAQSSVRLGE